MANVALGNLLQGFVRLMYADGDRSMKQAARMICREGAVVSGRMIKASVRRHVPVFRPPGFFPFGATRSRAKYGLVPGELRDAIYFTNARRGFNWSKGKLRYIVGFPHAKRGQNTPGWYAHWVEFGHWRRNDIAVNPKTDFRKPLAARETRRMRRAIKFVEGTPFMAPGIAAVAGAIPGIMTNAMRKQMGIEIAKLKLR